jgi:hypothetical protein
LGALFTHICPQQRVIFSPQDATAPQIKHGVRTNTPWKRRKGASISPGNRRRKTKRRIMTISSPLTSPPIMNKPTILVLKNN